MRRSRPMKRKRVSLLLSGVILATLANLAYGFGQGVDAHDWSVAAFLMATIIASLAILVFAALSR